MFDQEKTEAATPRRRQQAREKGQSGRSQDLVAALVLLSALFLLYRNGERLVVSILRFSLALYRDELWLQADSDTVTRFLSSSAFSFILSMASVALMLVVVGVGVNIFQSGWTFLPERILPHFDRISPARGLARIFCMDAVVRTGTGLTKIGFCSLAVWLLLRSKMNTILQLGSRSPGEIFHYLVDFLFKTSFTIGLVLLSLAILDVFWQKWKFERDLRMTPQEIREELKETIGDPIIIEQRRRRQQEVGTARRQAESSPTFTGTDLS